MAIQVSGTPVIDNSRNIVNVATANFVTAKAQRYNETYVTYSGTQIQVNTANGNMFAATLTGNASFAFTGAPSSGTGYGFVLKVTSNGDYTISWPTSVDWNDATAPAAPAAQTTSIYAFFTHDGGATWYGFEGGKAMG